MLLLDDEAELPASPSAEELNLAKQIGEAGLKTLDQKLIKNATGTWRKAAMILVEAIGEGGFQMTSEAAVHLHARRLSLIVQNGSLEAQGNLKKPRFSEVRTPRPV